MFKNREDAAERLAALLKDRPLHDPLVLGIPRGGVVIAATLARALSADLDIALSRKLRAPHTPEVAIGAVPEQGEVYLTPEAHTIANEAYIAEETAYQREEIARRGALFRAASPPAALAGRTVIVADDGIATGATMIAALQAAHAGGAKELIAAAPVAAPERLAEVRRWCDEAVCLAAPAWFRAVGQLYADFSQVEDDEVVRLLRRHAPAASD